MGEIGTLYFSANPQGGGLMNGLIQHLATSGLDLSEDNILHISVSNTIWWYYNDIVRWDLPNEFYLVTYASLWSPTNTTTDNSAYLIQHYQIVGTTKTLLKSIDHDSRGTHVTLEEKSPSSGSNLQYFLDESVPVYACGIYLKSI